VKPTSREQAEHANQFKRAAKLRSAAPQLLETVKEIRGLLACHESAAAKLAVNKCKEAIRLAEGEWK